MNSGDYLHPHVNYYVISIFVTFFRKADNGSCIVYANSIQICKIVITRL